MSFYGIVGFIVWILSDKFGITNSYRIVIIACVLLTLPIALVGSFVVSRRSKKKAEKAKELEEAKAAEKSAEKSDAAPQKLTAPTGNYPDLDKSAEEVVQFLKNSNLGQSGKDAVYNLPWYIVAGTTRGGKSSLVLGSNLNFQTLPSQRQSEQKFVRPTQSVDWRVTSDAVFADTAGRFQTEGADEDEWAVLLETIKKYRKARPIDGFLLIVNAEKILNSDETEIEQTAKILRARLDEAMQRIKVRFPVYLIFTHADAVEGFRDSFSTSKNEGKNLVWGATIPLEKSENAQALFDGEYELLQSSIMKRRLIRLSAPFPPVRQLRIFNFPLHFASARRKFGTFVSTLFRPNPFSENPFLRGFYFTAAPIQRSPAPNAPQTVGNTYFTEKLFRDVILRDKDLVRTFQEQRQKPPLLGWALTLLGAFLVLLMLTMAGVSLYNNRQMLEEATNKGEAVLTIVKADAGKNPLDKKPDEASRELNATEDLRQLLVKLDEYERNGAPTSMRMGLYSGDSVYRENLLPIYFSVVEQRFKTPTVKKVEAELKKFAASSQVSSPTQLTSQDEENLGKTYDLLKAYLMLSGDYKDKAEGSHIANTLRPFWTSEAKLPPGMELSAQQQLDFWAKQIDRDKFPRINLDKGLVEAARRKLQAFPAVYRYYKGQVTEVSKEIDEKIGPTTVDGLLNRNGADAGFLEGTYQVPGAYTLEGFQLMKTAIKEADTKLSADDWVMGEQGKSAIALSTDASKLQERYERDYTDHWRNFVKGVNVKSYTKENAKDALQTFSSANSPMKILVQQIARNTNFSAKPAAAGWWGWFMSFFQRKQSVKTGGNTQMEKEFLPLFTFVGSADKPNAPIEAYQSEIGRVANRFSGLSITEINQLSQDLARDDDKKFPELRNANTKIGALLGSFNSTPSGQELASLLKKPLENLSALLGADAQSQLGKTWRDQILPLAREAEKGFPFEESQNEADLTKLTAYLNPVDGKLSKFYDERLKKYFDGNPGQMRLKDSSDVKFSDEFVAYLNRAFLLREALYGKNAAPNFEYDFKLQAVKDALIEVTIDGQKITSEGTASSKLKFPAPAATDTGVFMNFASTSAAGSTSGSSLPRAPAANTSLSNANVSSNTNAASTVKPTVSGSGEPTSASIKQPGTWGLFRFFYSGNPQKTPMGEYTLTHSLGGKTVVSIVKPSGGDLFDKELFRSVRSPEKLLK